MVFDVAATAMMRYRLIGKAALGRLQDSDVLNNLVTMADYFDPYTGSVETREGCITAPRGFIS